MQGATDYVIGHADPEFVRLQLQARCLESVARAAISGRVSWALKIVGRPAASQAPSRCLKCASRARMRADAILNFVSQSLKLVPGPLSPSSVGWPYTLQPHDH